jgi:hypothetical protein
MSDRTDSVPLREPLADWLLGSGLLDGSARAELESAWRRVAGEGVAGQTRVVGFRKGHLWVEVASAPLRAELAGFRKAELLEGLRQRYTRRHIADLRFLIPGSSP